MFTLSNEGQCHTIRTIPTHATTTKRMLGHFHSHLGGNSVRKSWTVQMRSFRRRSSKNSARRRREDSRRTGVRIASSPLLPVLCASSILFSLSHPAYGTIYTHEPKHTFLNHSNHSITAKKNCKTFSLFNYDTCAQITEGAHTRPDAALKGRAEANAERKKSTVRVEDVDTAKGQASVPASNSLKIL